MAFKLFENKYQVIQIPNEYKQYLGYELIAMNNIPFSEIYDRMLNFISYENLYVANIKVNNNISKGHVLKYLNIIKNYEDDIIITLKDYKSDETVDIKIPLVDSSIASSSNISIQSTKPNTEMNFLPRDIYYRSIELNKDSYFIQYNKCFEDKNYSIDDFQKQISQDIENNSYKKVIIDLRYNEGGSEYFIKPIINELSRLKSKYGFDVYTLIGNNTFSSGVGAAFYINKNVINTLVGSPTGGKPNCEGNIILLPLKNTPIGAYYTMAYFKSIPYDDMMALYPDITIEQTFEDYVNGIDTVVEAVVKME